VEFGLKPSLFFKISYFRHRKLKRFETQHLFWKKKVFIALICPGLLTWQLWKEVSQNTYTILVNLLPIWLQMQHFGACPNVHETEPRLLLKYTNYQLWVFLEEFTLNIMFLLGWMSTDSLLQLWHESSLD